MSNNLKRICFVLPSLQGGGAERVVAKVAQYLNREYTDSIKITLVLLCENADEFKVDNVELVRLRARDVKSSFFPFLRYLRASKPDAIMSSLTHVTVLCSAAALICRIPHVSRVANTVTVETSNSRLWRLLSRINFYLDRHIIAVSQGVADDLTTRVGVTPTKVSVVRNPIVATNTLVHRPQTARTIRVLFIGRLAKQKNIKFLLNVALHYKKEIELRIVGKGVLQQELENFISENNLKEVVRLVGFTNKIEEQFSWCDVVVLCSLYEGLPNVLLEAISFGIPVVSNDCPSGPREIVVSPSIGSLVDELDHDKFFSAIKNEFLLDSNDRRAKRAEIALQEFGIKKIAASYYQVFQNV